MIILLLKNDTTNISYLVYTHLIVYMSGNGEMISFQYGEYVATDEEAKKIVELGTEMEQLTKKIDEKF